MSKAVVIKPENSVSERPEQPSISVMIERIITDPTVSVERVNQAFEFWQRVKADGARQAYFSAFSKMQPALPAAERKGKSHNGKYARFEDITAAIMPVLARHGFGVSYRVVEHPGKVLVKCIVSHVDGHAEETEYPFSYDTSGSKNPIQAIGSAMSYGKRYTLSSILGLSTIDEGADDDGKKAGEGALISEAQYKELAALITETGTDLAKFLEIGKVESLSDILSVQFDKAKAMLLAKKRKAAP